MKIDQ
jgi:hypothetical protein